MVSKYFGSNAILENFSPFCYTIQSLILLKVITISLDWNDMNSKYSRNSLFSLLHAAKATDSLNDRIH